MKRVISLLAVTAIVFGALLMSAPLRAEPVLAVTAVDTHGKTQEYLKRLDQTIKIGKSLVPDGIWRVWVASYSGASTGTVYVTVEYKSEVALAKADAAMAASKKFTASIAALAEIGRTIESRAILNDVTP